jgi:DNA-binding XRE family transcriptional regulator
MNRDKKQALEAAGWVFGDAADFLELTPGERAIVELRLAISRVVRALREKQALTQSEIAKRMGTSQSRYAKIESGESGVSLDLMVRGLAALGGKVTVSAATRTRKPTRQAAVHGSGGIKPGGKANVVVRRKGHKKSGSSVPTIA